MTIFTPCNSTVDQLSITVLRRFLPYIRRDLTNLINETVASLRESLHEELMEYIKQTASDLLHTSLQSTCNTEQLCAKMDTLDLNVNSVNTELSSLKGSLSNLNDSMNRISDNVEAHEDHLTTELTELDQNLQQNFSLQLNNSFGYIYPVYTCGGTEGWRRVVYLDMTDPDTTCPSGWKLTSHSKRTCGGVSVGSGFSSWFKCDSVTFPVTGGDYSSVCGRIRSYQYGNTLAFYAYNLGTTTFTIDSAYVDGIGLTHGSPRQHIWTFVAGISEVNDYENFEYDCACDDATNTNIPPFVGEDYFCESGHNSGPTDSIYETFYPDDPLWDADGCTASSTCCSFNNPPYFTKELPNPTNDSIEARLCHFYSERDTPIEFMELYVK